MKITTFRRKYHLSVADFRELQEAGLPVLSKTDIDEEDAEEWLYGQTTAQTDRLLTTANAIAKACGVSPNTVRNWKSIVDCPIRDDGTVRQSEIIAWHENRNERRGRPKLEVVPKMQDANERYREMKADREEIKLLQERGDVVGVEEVQRYLARSTSRAKSILGTLPSRVGRALKGRSGRKITDTVVKEIRQEVTEIVESLQQQIADDTANLLTGDDSEDVASE